MGNLKELQDNLSKELGLVSTEIASLQKNLENLVIRQHQLNGAVFALGLAQAELDKPDTLKKEEPKEEPKQEA